MKKIIQTLLILILLLLISASLIMPVHADVLINEFIPDPDADWNGNGMIETYYDEWIELYNTNGSEEVNISGWELADKGGQTYTIPSGTNISANGFLIFYGNETGIMINNDGGWVRLSNDTGVEMDNKSYTDSSPHISIGRATDGGTTWTTFNVPTPNSSNNFSTASITSWSNNKTNNDTLTGINLNQSEPIKFNATSNRTVTWKWYNDNHWNQTNESVSEAKFTANWSLVGSHEITLMAISATNGTSTMKWEVNVLQTSDPESPNITDWSPTTDPTNYSSENITFSVKANETVNVTWYINGSFVQTNTSVAANTWADYTNSSAKIGYWNVTAFVNNTNGTDSHQWNWTVLDPIEIRDENNNAWTSPNWTFSGETGQNKVNVSYQNESNGTPTFHVFNNANALVTCFIYATNFTKDGLEFNPNTTEKINMND